MAAALEAEQEGPDEDEADEDEDARRGLRTTRTTKAQAPPARQPRRAGPDPPQAQALEGTFDHGDEGYGLWLDPAIQDDPVYAEHWAGHRPVTVTVEAERIIIIAPAKSPPPTTRTRTRPPAGARRCRYDS